MDRKKVKLNLGSLEVHLNQSKSKIKTSVNSIIVKRLATRVTSYRFQIKVLKISFAAHNIYSKLLQSTL